MKTKIKKIAIYMFAVLCLQGCGKPAEPITKSGFLLNTFVTLTVYDNDQQEVLEECMGLCREYEELLSKTMEGSDVYRINHREAGTREMEVSEETAEVIEKGLYYSRLSGGAFDITIEPVSSLWDFTAAEPKVPDQELISQNLKNVGYEKISVSGNNILFQDDETRIDLGAIAKGYIADRLKEYLESQGVESAIINLGGNVLCVGGRPDGKDFQIGIQKPYGERSETVAAVAVNGMSVVSSGVYERHFVQDGINYHHILDPSTGYPYENGLTEVTILSEKSVDGDGLSTTCFSLGLEKGMELVDSLEGVWGIFITEDGELHYSEGMEDWLVDVE